MAHDNKSLGRFILDGIPPAPRGMPQVEVTFDIDANGILSVKAKEKSTGKEQSIRIEARSALTPEEIEKMKNEAAAHEAEDKAKREEAETKNLAEQLVYTAEKSLKDAGDKVPADVKSDVEAKIADLKKAKEGTDLAAIKSASEALSGSLSKIGEAMMKNGSTGSPQDQQGKKDDGKGPEGNVKDADFEEKK